MSFPTQSCNLVGAQVLTATDLGLSGNLASGASTDSIAFSTGVPATVLVIASASAGGSTSALKLKVGATAAITMSSGTTDVTVPSLGSNYNTINTTTASPFVRLRLTDTLNSTSYSVLSVFVLYGLTAGEDSTNGIRAGLGAVSSTKIGDGSGTLTLSSQ